MFGRFATGGETILPPGSSRIGPTNVHMWKVGQSKTDFPFTIHELLIIVVMMMMMMTIILMAMLMMLLDCGLYMQKYPC